MKLTIVGSGYVGLVTGACFADMGNDVTCVDNDAEKVVKLRDGVVPIHEPGLAERVADNLDAGRLHFTTGLADALQGSHAVFIAVGTPPRADGSADLSQVLAVARQIGQAVAHDLVVVDKSTVPVGTADQVDAAIREQLALRGVECRVEVVSNPEFLAEGAAVSDFMRPDRVIVGTDSPSAAALMRELYAPFCRMRDKVLVMGVRDAEMTKYAANAMLATRISFMNEIAAICECLDVDVEAVRQGLGADPRIGHRFLYPGAGYGGSCFPKDIRALVHMADAAGIDPMILRAVESRNATQKRVLFEKLSGRLGDLAGRTIAIWGLAFKPGTDDLREAPALALVSELLAVGAKVRAYDPVARAPEQPGFLQVDDQYEALDGADALVLVTEWKQFRQPDFPRIKAALKQPLIVDGRNQYDPDTMRAHGISYMAVGRSAGQV